MEYTEDVLEHRFTVAGGSGVRSDGHYYWRSDAADYVEKYGIEVPPDAISWMRSNNWVAPVLSVGEILEVDRALAAILTVRRSE
jgi:hypothetical protein